MQYGKHSTPNIRSYPADEIASAEFHCMVDL